MHLGTLVKKHREMKRLSQKDVANKLGVHSQHLSNIELLKSPLPAKHFKKISKILDINLSELIEHTKKSFEAKLMKEIKSGKY